MKSREIEITAPVGSFASLAAAIEAGADSVYFGAGNLNMRALSSANFSLDDIPKITAICRDNGIKSYLTLNTVVYDEEIPLVESIIEKAKKSEADAIIASDMAVLEKCREQNVPVIASTQLNVSNFEAVKFFAKYVDAITLARELDLEQIKKIARKIEEEKLKGPSGKLVKIETFVHGAMCMAISGKCYLSLRAFARSANRGECLQPCRRKYIVKDKSSDLELEIDNEYIMSSKDLCAIGFLDKIIEAGVSILKIEGRSRSPEYVKITVSTYKEALRAVYDGEFGPKKIKKWLAKLSEVYNRGFWDGHYLGEKMGAWAERYGSSATKRKVYLGKAEHYYPKIKVAVFKMESGELNEGDEIVVIGPTTGAYIDFVRELRIDGKAAKKAVKGDLISFPVAKKIRDSDILYKFEKR